MLDTVLAQPLRGGDSPPRVRRHGCRRTVRSRSQGRRPATKQIRQEVEFRLKSVVVTDQREGTERASPVARRRRSVDVRRSSGPVLNAKPLNVLDHKCSKLGSRISPYIKSAVPPADSCSEVAIAAPMDVHAPMDLGQICSNYSPLTRQPGIKPWPVMLRIIRARSDLRQSLTKTRHERFPDGTRCCLQGIGKVNGMRHAINLRMRILRGIHTKINLQERTFSKSRES